MYRSSRDIAFLRVHYSLCKNVKEIPEDKQWLILYLKKVERIIATYYFIMIPAFSHKKTYRGILFRYFTDFTGRRITKRFFYHTIDKIEFLCKLMEKAQVELNFQLLSVINKGNYKYKINKEKL